MMRSLGILMQVNEQPMYPTNFLKTYWRMEMRDTVFVAMDFGATFQSRFDEVFKPAIEDQEFYGGLKLKAHKVDLSTTGDSILTDILDSIAHCRLFLADVSVVGDMVKRSERTGDSELIPVRNSNVLYEVGIALACRQPEEVLIVRDDHREKFLFDIAAFPYKTIDFSDKEKAKQQVREMIDGRLKEQKYIRDSRVAIAVKRLTVEEVRVLQEYAAHVGVRSRTQGAPVVKVDEASPADSRRAIERIVDKSLIVLVGGFTETFSTGYEVTELGWAVIDYVKLLPRIVIESDQSGSAPPL